MSEYLERITHGTSGLVLGYVLTLAGIVIGLLQARVPWGRLATSPIFAILVTLIGAIAASLANSLLRAIGLGGELLEIGFGSVVIVGTGYVAGRVWAARGRPPYSTHRRGAVIAHAAAEVSIGGYRTSRAGIGEASGSKPITIAGVPVRIEDETKHFKLIGTTGTGKSTAIREILRAALERGDRAIIADPDGGYLNRFYDPARGDVILNPFDAEARRWSFFSEVLNDYDIEQLARSLIPDGGDSDRIWSEYARTFVVEVTRQAIRAGKRSDNELLRLLISASDDELRMLLAGTPAGPFLGIGNEKMFGSIRSVTTSAMRSLEHTTKQEAEPFSVRQWVREGASKRAGGAGGVLFLPYRAGEIAVLRSMISAWMRLGIFEAMDREEGDQRLWFIVDELDALGEIDGLKDALARLRKFGGRCVLGFQSIAQVSGSYGRAAAETIVENCGNTLILRCSASERGGTAEFASKLIGQREVLQTTISRTRAAGAWRSSTTTSQHLQVETAVLASEIERLPDLAGFLKLASVADWHFVELTPMAEAGEARRRRPTVVASSPPAGGAGTGTAPPPRSEPTAPEVRAQRASPRKKRATQSKVVSRRKLGRVSSPSNKGAPEGPEPPSGTKPDAPAEVLQQTKDDARL